MLQIVGLLLFGIIVVVMNKRINIIVIIIIYDAFPCHILRQTGMSNLNNLFV